MPSCGFWLTDCRNYVTQNALRLHQLKTHTTGLDFTDMCFKHDVKWDAGVNNLISLVSLRKVWMRNISLLWRYLSKVSMVKLISGLLRKVQNCLGVGSPVLSPQPAAGRTTATGKPTASRPVIPSQCSDSNFRKSPGSPGRRSSLFNSKLTS